MEGQLRTSREPAGSFTREAIAALRALDAMGHDPLIIGFYPTGGLNPYQELLYGRVWQHGMAAIPLRGEAIPEITELSRTGVPTVLHLHWLNRVLGRAETLAEARANRQAFLDVLDRHRDAGGHVAWTIHNVLPHHTRFEDEEVQLSVDVVERSDVIHVLAERTVELVRPRFVIPGDKVLRVPHPAYTGAYEDRVTREEARHQLGIWPDELVYLVIGAIRPYKGMVRLLDAWDTLASDGVPRRLVIVGRAGHEPGVPEIIERAALHPTVLVHPASFEPGDVQVYMRATDVAVHPHLVGLNSGALMLALTFGVPVVVPADSGLAEIVDDRFARTFSADDDEANENLADVLRSAGEIATPAARAAALEVAASHAPGPLADQFAAGIRARVMPSATGS
jgi:glycosyltransferase involved in cell wall biosynthesis